MVNCEEIIKKIESNLKVDEIEVLNPQKDNLHFQLKIKSSELNGLTMINQHRLIYSSLGELMEGIHALKIDIKE